MPKKEERERARATRCFIAGGFVVLTDRRKGHTGLERAGQEGARKDRTTRVTVRAGREGSIKSADSRAPYK